MERAVELGPLDRLTDNLAMSTGRGPDCASAVQWHRALSFDP